MYFRTRVQIPAPPFSFRGASPLELPLYRSLPLARAVLLHSGATIATALRKGEPIDCAHVGAHVLPLAGAASRFRRRTSVNGQDRCETQLTGTARIVIASGLASPNRLRRRKQYVRARVATNLHVQTFPNLCYAVFLIWTPRKTKRAAPNERSPSSHVKYWVVSC